MSHSLAHAVIELHASDLLRFRLRKLTNVVAEKISASTRMFDPGRTPDDLADATEYFGMFMTTYLAVAWSMYIANAVPRDDSEIYSGGYLELDVDEHSFLTLLTEHVMEKGLLPDYRLGFLVALLTACHVTRHVDAQKRLWSELKLQLSNLFASTCTLTEVGVQIYADFKGCHQDGSIPNLDKAQFVQE